MKKLFILLTTIGITHFALACTAVDVKALDGSIIAGRTMEFAYDLKWKLLVLPKGTPYELTAPQNANLSAVKLISKYAFIGFGVGLANDAILEGQNSAGLAISANYLPGFTQYQTVTKTDKKYVSVYSLGQFILSNFASVAEVRKELPEYKVWGAKNPNLPTSPTLHFLFTDKTGDSLVVEYVGGQIKLYNHTANVMTNAPTYSWHLDNLRNYLYLSNTQSNQKTFDGVTLTALGSGVGSMGLPGDYTPPSRFVKAFFLNSYAEKAKNASEATQLTLHILNNFDIPKGVVASTENGHTISDYTQWIAIKDLNNNKLYFADYDHRSNLVEFDLQPIFASNKKIITPIQNIQYPSLKVELMDMAK